VSRAVWHRRAPRDRLARPRGILFPLWVLGSTLLVLFPIYLVFMVSVAPGIAIFGERPALLVTHPTLRFWMRIIATLMMSAALPWIGAFKAARSAASRTLRLLLSNSGRYRRLPNTVDV